MTGIVCRSGIVVGASPDMAPRSIPRRQTATFPLLHPLPDGLSPRGFNALHPYNHRLATHPFHQP